MSDKTFRKVTGGSDISYIRPAELAESGTTGVILEGVYVEALPNKLNNTVSDYKFQLEDGRVAIINHSGNLAYLMRQVSPGDLVRVSYVGKEVLKSGKMKGKSAHTFSLEVAE